MKSPQANRPRRRRVQAARRHPIARFRQPSRSRHSRPTRNANNNPHNKQARRQQQQQRWASIRFRIAFFRKSSPTRTISSTNASRRRLAPYRPRARRRRRHHRAATSRRTCRVICNRCTRHRSCPPRRVRRPQHRRYFSHHCNPLVAFPLSNSINLSSSITSSRRIVNVSSG